MQGHSVPCPYTYISIRLRCRVVQRTVFAPLEARICQYLTRGFNAEFVLWQFRIVPELNRRRYIRVGRHAEALEDIAHNGFLRHHMRDRLTNRQIVERREACVEGEEAEAEIRAGKNVDVRISVSNFLQDSRVATPFAQEVDFARLK